MAFGWLPDKSFVSYQIFLILLMEAFQSHSPQIKAIFGKSKLKMKKIKMDFEVNIIRTFDVLFTIRGCLFHFSQAGNNHFNFSDPVLYGDLFWPNWSL